MEKKKISLGVALIPLLSLGALVGVVHLWLGVNLQFILLIATLIAGATGSFLGYKIDEQIKAIGKTIQKAFPVILILICIGGIVGTWMFSGTVPYLIYYGLKLIHPDYVPVMAFLVTALISLFTGTSWGSAATSGVAFIGIAMSMGIPLPIVAGAVLSGAVLGDKVSPISDTTNICALASEVSVYDHIKGMLPNVLLAGLIAAIGFLIIGFNFGGGEVRTETYQFVLNDINSIYNLNILMLLPALVVFIGGFKGYNPVVLMVSSSILAIVIGTSLNGFSFQDGAQSMVSGFSTTMTDVTTDVSAILSSLLTRGGFEGMMKGAVLFCILAIAFGAVMEHIGALNRIMRALLVGIKTAFGVVITAFVSGGLLNAVTGSAMFSILTIGQMFREPFEERGLSRTILSRSMENSMTLLESLIPWHVTAIYMTATLGVSTLDYMPYAFFNISGIILFFFLSYRTIKRTSSPSES